MNYEFDIYKNEMYKDEFFNQCQNDLESDINIRSVALDILKNWNMYRQSGNDIMKEYLFSLDELADFFFIRIDKQEEFKDLLIRAHHYFQNNKDQFLYENMSYEIGGTLYFCVPNLLKFWPLIENIVPISIYYKSAA